MTLTLQLDLRNEPHVSVVVEQLEDRAHLAELALLDHVRLVLDIQDEINGLGGAVGESVQTLSQLRRLSQMVPQ